MKQMVVVNQMGHTVYYDADNTSFEMGSLSGSQLHAMEQQLSDLFGDEGVAFREMRRGTLLMVMERIDGYPTMVCSDEGDSAALLRQQARLAHAIFRMIVGEDAYDAKKRSNKNLWGHIPRMVPLVRAMSKLTHRQQPFLVEATEKMILNEQNGGLLREMIEEPCKEHAPDSAHALLFVGSKLAADWTRDSTQQLNPKDIVLINLIRSAALRPELTRPPDGALAKARQRLEWAKSGHRRLGLPWRLVEPKLVDQIGALLLGNASEAMSRRVEEEQQRAFDMESGTDSSSLYSSGEAASETIKVLHVTLDGKRAVRCHIFVGVVDRSTSLVVVSPCVAASADKASEQRKRAMSTGASSRAGRVSDETRAIYSKVLEMFTQKYEGCGLDTYLPVQAAAHVTMLKYLSRFPGLVHFIFVDRSTNEVVAPRITSLGHPAGEKTPAEQRDAARLKNKIWEMYGVAKHCQREGYDLLTMREGEFCYACRLWHEESKSGDEVPPSTEGDDDFLTNLRSIFKPGSLFGREQTKQLELYTIHLASLPAAAIAATNTRLLEMLRDGGHA